MTFSRTARCRGVGLTAGLAGWMTGPLALLAMLALPFAASAQTPQHAPPPALSCPGDRPVWVNTRSGVYHYAGERYYGSTKEGKFTCERAARQEGDRPTRNGQ